jgi:opacity protein-like surface antigen
MFGTIAAANAEPTAGVSNSIHAVQPAASLALPHSDADGQLRKESARADDTTPTGGFRAEVEAVASSLNIPGLGMTPVGNLEATRLMLNGLYEVSGGGWRMKPYLGAGFGVIDINARLLGHEETTLFTDFQVKGGVNYNITQQLFGRLEYRWSQGEKPSLGIAGVPAKFQLKSGGFRIGLNYRLQ